MQSQRVAENEQLTDKIEKIYAESPDKGYRRLNDDLRHDYGIHVNDKRVLRICRARDIRSTVKYNNHSCTRRAKTPQYLAENLLSRQFYADKPNEKWLTDVTKFKWYEGVEVHKLYLSAILDLCDRRIVFYALSERNDNPLVDQALAIQGRFLQSSYLQICSDPTGNTPLPRLMDRPYKPDTEHGMSFSATVAAVILGVMCAILILSFL